MWKIILFNSMSCIFSLPTETFLEAALYETVDTILLLGKIKMQVYPIFKWFTPNFCFVSCLSFLSR